MSATTGRTCTHVSGFNHCRVPRDGEKWVHCPCCWGNGVAAEDDDLTDPPMVCPPCGVPAVSGRGPLADA